MWLGLRRRTKRIDIPAFAEVTEKDLGDLDLSHAPAFGSPSERRPGRGTRLLAERSQERADTIARGASASATSRSGSGRSR